MARCGGTWVGAVCSSDLSFIAAPASRLISRAARSGTLRTAADTRAERRELRRCCAAWPARSSCQDAGTAQYCCFEAGTLGCGFPWPLPGPLPRPHVAWCRQCARLVCCTLCRRTVRVRRPSGRWPAAQAVCGTQAGARARERGLKSGSGARGGAAAAPARVSPRDPPRATHHTAARIPGRCWIVASHPVVATAVLVCHIPRLEGPDRRRTHPCRHYR